MLKSKWIASDDQVFESWQLGHRIEELLFMDDLVEGEVQLFQVREGLLLYGQLDVVLW